MLLTVVINPISGVRGGSGEVRRRTALASAWMRARAQAVDVQVTERAGHARALASAAVERGATVVVAWGGDGTVNEVASALAHRSAALAIVPGGSGNGLARELGVPREPAAALDVALDGEERTIDMGELDGRLFANVAGVGLDATVAHQFAAGGRRGLGRYLTIGLAQLLGYRAVEYRLRVDGVATETRALLVAFANARQYGNGAVIAPRARIDDGKLDLVVVGDRSPLALIWEVPRLFRGTLERAPGVTMTRFLEVSLTAGAPLVCHVDGEPYVGGRSVMVRAIPAALRVLVPRKGPYSTNR